MTAVSSTKVALRPQQEMSAALPATLATPAARAHIPSLARSPLVGHCVVSEILLRHMSSNRGSRELHGPLRRFADKPSKRVRKHCAITQDLSAKSWLQHFPKPTSDPTSLV